MRDVYETVRVWTEHRKTWTGTASQTKDPGGQKGSKKNVDVYGLADSLHKSRVLDILITLNFNEDQMTYFMAKHRTGKSRYSVGPLPTDFPSARISPLTHPLAGM